MLLDLCFEGVDLIDLSTPLYVPSVEGVVLELWLLFSLWELIVFVLLEGGYVGLGVPDCGVERFLTLLVTESLSEAFVQLVWLLEFPLRVFEALHLSFVVLLHLFLSGHGLIHTRHLALSVGPNLNLIGMLL